MENRGYGLVVQNEEFTILKLILMKMSIKRNELWEVVTPRRSEEAVLRKGHCGSRPEKNIECSVERSVGDRSQGIPCVFERRKEYYDDVEFYDALFEDVESDFFEEKAGHI